MPREIVIRRDPGPHVRFREPFNEPHSIVRAHLPEIETIYRAYQVLLLKPATHASDGSIVEGRPLQGRVKAHQIKPDFSLRGRLRRAPNRYSPGYLGAGAVAAGLANFASSTGTFCFTSLTSIVKRPLGRASVHL
jgi:hypothetical protein